MTKEGLTKCRVCDKDVAEQALKCPHCGAKLGSGNVEQIVLFLFFALMIIVVCALLGFC